MATKLKIQPIMELYFTTLLTYQGPELIFYTNKGIVDINKVPFIFVKMEDNPKRIMKAAEKSESGSGVIRLYNEDMRVEIRALKHRKDFGLNFPYPFYEKTF